jgi:hypothetical protein
MSVNSKHLNSVHQSGGNTIDIFFSRQDGVEAISLEQNKDLNFVEVVTVTLDGLGELISALQQAQEYYRPTAPVGVHPQQLQFDLDA